MSRAPNTRHSTKAMPLVLSCSSTSQSISKWKQSFFLFVILPEKSSAFLKMFKNLHFTNFSVTVNAPSQAMCCHQLSSMTHCTHFTVKTCQQWLLLCNDAKKMKQFTKEAAARREGTMLYSFVCPLSCVGWGPRDHI